MANINKNTSIGLVSLILILISSILSIGNWHLAAQFGINSIFYLSLASIFFMIPVAFVAAELSSSYHSKGGLFVWVKEAFGMKVAVLCAWLMWVSNVVWYPTVFSFMASTVLHYFGLDISHNRFYIFALMVALFWFSTLVNIKGIKFSSKSLSLSVVLSMILPAFLLIIFGVYWVFSNQVSQISYDLTTSLPAPKKLEDVVLFTGLLLGYTGMEMAMVYYPQVNQPKRVFPKAIWLATGFMLVISVLGTLGIALVIPKNEINLLTDSLNAIHFYLSYFKLDYWMPFLNLLIMIGTLVGMSAYLAEPSKAFLQAVKSLQLSRQLERSNKHAMPITLMFLQAVIVSVISFIFLFIANITDSYWILTDLASQLYLIIYVVMFLAVIKLKVFKNPDEISVIPFGKKGIWILGITGILMSGFSFFIGCLPPKEIDVKYPFIYTLGMLILLAIMTFFPLIWYYIKNVRQKKFGLQKGDSAI
jgi:amino acid transporter